MGEGGSMGSEFAQGVIKTKLIFNAFYDNQSNAGWQCNIDAEENLHLQKYAKNFF